jgi:superfamily II DNA or RNA helicase
MSNSLLEAIREAALPGIWSQGVKLARAGAVALQSRSDKELELRVRVAGRPVPWTVVLYPADEVWECDCPGKTDPCEHAVAAAISLQQESSAQAPIASAAARWARVAYRFARAGGGLELTRALVHADGSVKSLDGTLAALLAQPAKAAELQVEEWDLRADNLLARPTRGPLPPDKLELLLNVLANARTVTLDGRPVAISDELVFPRATIEDHGEDVVLRLGRDPRVTEVVSAGVALCGDLLCRLGETQTTGRWLENLPIARTFGPAQIAELAARVLPELARRMPVDVRSKRVPPVDRALEPRVLIELNQVEGGLSVLPKLVYGAPPHVRIDNGRMVYLRGAVPLRDEAAEQRMVHQLRDELNLVPGHRTTVTGEEKVRFADKLRRWRGGLVGDAAGLVSPNAKLKPVLRLDSKLVEGGLPEVRLEISFELQTPEGTRAVQVDAGAVLSAWREGLGLVPIEGGGWAPLPAAWLEKHGERIADLLAARGADGKVAAHALPALGALCETLEQPPPPGLDRLAPLIEGFDGLPPAQLPADLEASLRPYQEAGVRWLTFLRQAGLGGVLADDMGLGKTLQTLCVLGKGSLVVCPTSVLPNWLAEIKRFRPSLKVGAYHGPGRTLDAEADITVTTYAILRLDLAALTARTWNTVVLDEAQSIKNPESQSARAAFALKSDFRLALSGTPVENRLDDLWSLMHFANPGLLGGRREFAARFSEPIAEGRQDVAARLQRRIRPFVLRRLKSEVAKDLPPRSEAVLRVGLDERERAIYDSVYAATRAEVVSLLGQGGNVLKALEALLRLRQAACHPALVPGQVAKTSSKVERLAEVLGNAVADGHKALVFSQWTSLLDLIEPALKAAEIPFERLDGSTPNRGEVTARFQSPEGAPVMLISLKAGGTGLNLTAADHVFLVDPWWNPAAEAQAADRAHRIGQERPVFVYRMIAEGTIEERILGLQEKKRALFEAALGDAGAATALTRDDLAELFA